jgi:23S rRNA (uracil1939-C5)-methyltransferase
MEVMKKQNVELEITALAYEGFGIARKDELVYFVKNVVPGDKINAQIIKKHKSYIEAKVEQILQPSADRINPRCEYFDDCGGCSLQNLNYENQLYWKKNFVAESLKRIGKVNVISIENTLAAPNEFHYRNKMEFSFSANRWLNLKEIQSNDEILQKNFALGLHTPKNYVKVIDINYCYIQQGKANEILNIVRKLALDDFINAYNSTTHIGFLKNLTIRYSLANDEFMVILITDLPNSEKENYFFNKIKNELDKSALNIASLIWAINNSYSPVAIGEIKEIVGKENLSEQILGINYRISPFSFFQTNSAQLNQFIKVIIDIADIQKEDFVMDLYCGTGSITLPAAKKCEKIIGFELVESSISDAKENAILNNIENAEFYAIDLHSKNIATELHKYGVPDILFIDPPRAGMHKNLLGYITNILPQKVVYVSCNPTTQARDLETLKEYYEVVTCIPVDMFPQTYHVESIIKLIKK